MSTLFFRTSGSAVGKKQIVGQRHALANHTGYHFTWAILPLEFMKWWLDNDDYSLYVVNDANARVATIDDFIVMVQLAVSQSYDERLRDVNP